MSIVAFDTPMLSLLLHQTARFPLDPTTGVPITRPKERIELLVSELSKAKSQILIPAPAFAEFLVVVEDAGPNYLQKIDRTSRFDIQPFDTMAAVEAAIMCRGFMADGDRRGGSTDDWQRVKVDHQIIAIARARGAERIYTADAQFSNICATIGFPCIQVWQLPLPGSGTPLLDALGEVEEAERDIILPDEKDN